MICKRCTQTSNGQAEGNGGTTTQHDAAANLQKFSVVAKNTFDQSSYAAVMSLCDHAYDADHPNPYHLEGDVKTHTDMVHQQMTNLLKELAPSERYGEAMVLEAIGHDFGKTIMRTPVPEKMRVRFNNHPQWSQILFYQYLVENGLADKYIENGMLYPMLLSINLHDDAFDIYATESPLTEKMRQKWGGMFAYNPPLLPLLASINYADDHGRITEQDTSNANNYYGDFIDSFGNPGFPERKAEPILAGTKKDARQVAEAIREKPTILMMVGLPGSGKSYLSNEVLNGLSEDEYMVVSFDDAVNKYAAENGMTYDEVHADKNLLDICHTRMNEEVERRLASEKKPKIIVLDKTHVSAKARNQDLVNLEGILNRARKNGTEFPDYRTVCVNAITPMSLTTDRVRNRPGKYIAQEVVVGMATRYSLPYFGERINSNRNKPWSYDNILIAWTNLNNEVTFQEYCPDSPQEVTANVDMNKLKGIFKKELEWEKKPEKLDGIFKILGCAS